MLIDFNYIGRIDSTKGSIKSGSSDLVVYNDNKESIMYIDEKGHLIASNLKSDNKVDKKVKALKDNNIRHFKISNLNDFGLVGAVKSSDDNFSYHKLLIYEYSYNLSRHLVSGKISHTLNNPISTFELNLANSKNTGRYLASYDKARSISLKPSSKIIINFSLGGNEAVKLGEYYIDSIDFDITNKDITIRGRNIIGKVLKDQTFDENNVFEESYIDTIVEKILLENANLDPNMIDIAFAGAWSGFKFDSTMTLFDGIKEVLKIDNDIVVRDLNGKIGVGKNETLRKKITEYNVAILNSNNDIFTRKVTKDDIDKYRRIHIRNKDKKIDLYSDIGEYDKWGIKAHRTLHVDALVDSVEDAEKKIKTMKELVKSAGEINSIETRFSPQYIVGSECYIDDEKIGLITSINHNFGENGFFTNLDVNSGAMFGSGLLSDYIGKLQVKNEWSSFSNNKPKEERKEKGE